MNEQILILIKQHKAIVLEIVFSEILRSCRAIVIFCDDINFSRDLFNQNLEEVAQALYDKKFQIQIIPFNISEISVQDILDILSNKKFEKYNNSFMNLISILRQKKISFDLTLIRPNFYDFIQSV
jgi:hypothetical protein